MLRYIFKFLVQLILIWGTLILRLRRNQQIKKKKFYDNWTDPSRAFSSRLGIHKDEKSLAELVAHQKNAIENKNHEQTADLSLQMVLILDEYAEEHGLDEVTKSNRANAEYNLAGYWAAVQKNINETVQWLDASLRDRFSIDAVRKSAAFNSMKDHPEFQRLMQKYQK